jgi:uncharacterized integral membrane protein (TIGR00697 family)
MNESLCIVHSLAVTCFLLAALYFGKTALTTFVATSWLLANFFVTKEILFFGFEVTASDAYTIGGMLALSCLQEYFGKEAAKRAIHVSFFVLLFALVGAFVHISYIPSPHDAMHPFFAKLLAIAPRLTFASAISFFLSQYSEIGLLALLRNRSLFPFWLRAYIAGALSQLIDTAAFSLIGLYGVVHSLSDVMLMSFCMKWLTLSFTVPFLAFSKRIAARTSHAL